MGWDGGPRKAWNRRAARKLSAGKERELGYVGDLALGLYMLGDEPIDIAGRRYYPVDWFAYADDDGNVVDLDEVLHEANRREMREPPPASCAVCGAGPGHRCAFVVGVSHDGAALAERKDVVWVR